MNTDLVYALLCLVTPLVLGAGGAFLYNRRRERRLLVGLIGGSLIIGLIVGWAVSALLATAPGSSQNVRGPGDSNLPTPTPLAMIEVVVAVRNVARGEVITPDSVDRWLYPADLAPVTALTSLDDVIGKIARTDLYREQPILTSLVVEDYNDLASVGGEPLELLPSGSLVYNQLVTGEINPQRWIEEWHFVGAAGETVTFTMTATAGDLQPFLLLWEQASEAWVDGQHSATDGRATLTATLPENGVYVVHASRVRLNNGDTAGTYELTAHRGYVGE